MLGFRPGPGGVGRVMVNLLTGMVRQGVAVDVLLPPGDCPDLAAAQISCGRYALDTGQKDRAISQLKEYLAERRPDAILSNKDRTNTFLAETTEAGQRPFTVFRIGTNVLEKLRRGSILSRPWKRRRLAALYRQADALIGISAGGSAALRRLMGDHRRPPVHTIWNPVDLEAVRALAREPPSHPWLAPGRGPVIVSVGRLVAAKHYQTLVRAFQILRGEIDCHLIIIGEGGHRARLTRLAARLGVEEWLDLPGFVANPFPFMARADLFAVSSVFEGANNALMEALALGVPCVSTDCPSGPREILDNGRYGRLVPVRSPAALADAMLRTLGSRPDPAVVRQGAERFDLDTNVQAYLDVLGGGAVEEPR